MSDVTQPFISIGIPTYRRHEYTQLAIESAAGQDYSNFEVLINDESKDCQSQAVAEALRSDKVIYRHTPNLAGLPKKLNDFLETARGEWLAILCDDDLLERDFLKTLGAHILNHPDAAVIRPRYKLIGLNNQLIRLDRYEKFFMTPFEFLSALFLPERHNFKMNISGILFRRSFLKQWGGFREYPKGWHIDRLALAQAGSLGPCLCEEKALCGIRLHPASITSSLEAEYTGAAETTLKTKEELQKVLDSMAPRAKSDEEKKLLALARERMNAFILRHLSRSMDHGLMAALHQDEKSARLKVKKIFKKIEELGIPKFRTAYLYQGLAFLPRNLRLPFLKLLRAYKLKRLTS